MHHYNLSHDNNIIFQINTSTFDDLKNRYSLNIDEILNTITNFIYLSDIDDINTIGTQNATRKASIFTNYIENIDGGFNDLIPCFWSCKDGKIEAMKQKEFSTDQDHPIIKLLFEYCTIIRKNIEQIYHEKNFKDDSGNNMKKIYNLMTQFSYGVSRIYARRVKNFTKNNQTIHVYIGTDKATEPPGFHIGNNFWKAELPVLQSFLHDGIIQDIILHIAQYNGSLCDGYGYNPNWKLSLSMFNDDINIPLWRRNWHPMDNLESSKSFTRPDMSQHDWNKWRLEPPRPYITFSRMKQLARTWKYLSL